MTKSDPNIGLRWLCRLPSLAHKSPRLISHASDIPITQVSATKGFQKYQIIRGLLDHSEAIMYSIIYAMAVSKLRRLS